MRMIFNAVRSWRWSTICWTLAVALPITLGCAGTAHAQTLSCAGATGRARALCNMEEARERSAANRARRDAAQAGQAPGEPVWGRGDPPMQSESAVPSGHYASQAGGVYAEPPTIDRSVKPARLTFVIHPAWSRTPGKLRLPITHGCGPGYRDQPFTFDRACYVDTMQGQSAALPLFQQSCQEGDPGGCFMYADHIASSRPAEALAMYDKLCDIGHPGACYRLAAAYENGNGVAKNAVMQRTYYGRACDAGNDYGCRFVAGQIDADCPHGHRGWRADVDRKIYKVVCVVDTGPLTTSEHEIPPKPGEIEAIKKMASQANTSIPQWMINALDDNHKGKD